MRPWTEGRKKKIGTLVKIASKPQGWGRSWNNQEENTPHTPEKTHPCRHPLTIMQCHFISQADMRNSTSYINSTWGDLSLATDSSVPGPRLGHVHGSFWAEHNDQKDTDFTGRCHQTAVMEYRQINEWILWSRARFISVGVINYSLNHQGVSPIHEEVFVLGYKWASVWVWTNTERGPVWLLILNCN